MQRWHAIMRQAVSLAFVLVLAFGLAFGAVGHAAATGGVIVYVRPGAGGTEDGSSWGNAYHNLQQALLTEAAKGAAAVGDQVWVGRGIYKPTLDTDRTRSFNLVDGVEVYGGFMGDETSLSDRDWNQYVTILSGEIGTALSDPTDNSYHVVWAESVGPNTVLDGFTITGGTANGPLLNAYGGGLYSSYSGPTLQNLVFQNNTAGLYGGGMYSLGSGPGGAAPHLIGVTFLNNTALSGGGMFNDGTNPILEQVTFTGNSAALHGGGLANSAGAGPTIAEVTLTNNRAAVYGGGIYDSGVGTELHMNGSLNIYGNQAMEGGGLYNSTGAITLHHMNLVGNTATDYGGGMYVVANGSTDISNVFIYGNTAVNGGGGLYYTGSMPGASNTQFVANVATTGCGGGVYVASSGPSFWNTLFSSNKAQCGGGLYVDANSSFYMLGATFTKNQAVYGGGVETAGTLGDTLENVTFSNNTGTSQGGAAFVTAGSPEFNNVTFHGNNGAGCGGAICNYGTPEITNSILWGDTGGEIVNIGATSPSIRNSIVQGAADAANNVLDVDPVLGPLQDNGGPTTTMALGLGSPAIDRGDISTCARDSYGAVLDQRGVSRPQGLGCDMGAYEVRAMSFLSSGKQDGWILESGEKSNLGGTMNTASTSLSVGDDKGNRQYRSILSFNTAALPNTATVVLGKLRVKQSGITVNPLTPFEALGILAFDIKTPKFGTSPALELGDFKAAPTVTGAGVMVPTQDILGWYTGFLNNNGSSHISKTSTTQLRLAFITDDDNDHVPDSLKIWSGNAAAADRPVLWVYYTRNNLPRRAGPPLRSGD